jgi:hypothetical protein
MKKQKLGSRLAIAAAAILPAVGALAAPFVPGDIAVYRVGTGSGSLVNTGNAVFIDEYNPSGTLIQSIAVPTAASGSNNPLVASGTATSEGLMTLSTDGRYLVFAGYGAAPGGAASLPASTTVPRVVGRLDLATGAVDTSTALTDYSSGNNPRGVASTDGSNFYLTGGTGGLRYAPFGGTTSTLLTAPPGVNNTLVNLRGVTLTGGNVNITTSSGSAVRIGQVGTGFPTAPPQDINPLPGTPTSGGSPYGMFFADLDATPGVETLYVADDTGTGSITKYGLVGGSWTAEGSVTAAGVRGLTGAVADGHVTLYASTGGSGAGGGGSLYRITDSSGAGNTFTGIPDVIATLGATSNEAFRGVAIVPEPASLSLLGLGAIAVLVRRRRKQA